MQFTRARIIACKAKPNYILWVRFSDGIEGEISVADLVGQGVFKAWESQGFWESAHINQESETVTWGDEIDLDPYVIKQEILNSQKKQDKEI